MASNDELAELMTEFMRLAPQGAKFRMMGDSTEVSAPDKAGQVRVLRFEDATTSAESLRASFDDFYRQVGVERDGHQP